MTKLQKFVNKNFANAEIAVGLSFAIGFVLGFLAHR